MSEVVMVGGGESAVLDVVFLHGLDGDVRRSWTGEDGVSFWPEWLVEDCPDVAVWSVGYEAWSSGWRGRAMPMQDRAINLMASLQNRRIGQRPLVFVTHSMGGLLTKEILLLASEARTDLGVFAAATRGVVFLGTPHTGSGLTGVVQALRVIYRSTAAVKDLERNSAHLRQLNDRYRDWVAGSGVGNLVFFEAYPTKGVQVVDAASANPGLVGVRPIPVDADHIGICKPAGRDALVYGQVKRFLDAILDTLVTGDTDTGRNVLEPIVAGDVSQSTHSVGRVPSDGGIFVGREKELLRLEEATTKSGRVVVHGLGGVGKSALAARFAEQYACQFSSVWWVIADSPAAIESGLADLAAAMDPDVAGLQSDQLVEHAQGWLAGHTGWLLVLDNLTTPAHTRGLLDRVRTGTILITSRQSVGWRGVTSVPLDVMESADAMQLLDLVVRVDWPQADLTGADTLCAELGWLPLAVEQAGAYLAQTRISPTDYLERLRAYPDRMFTATAEGGEVQRTMARVWHVTLDHLADTPAAGQVLRQLAWYAPDGVARTLLDVDGTVREPELSDTLGRLFAYNMIGLTADTVVVHRLVQAVTRTPNLTDPHRQPDDIAAARDAAAATLAAAIVGRSPEAPSDHPVFKAVRPHVQVLLDHTTPDTDNGDTIVVLGLLGLYLRDQGASATAVDLLARAAQGSERLYGLTRSTLVARNNLATAYNSAGRFDEAISLQNQNLEDRTELLGPQDADTLASRSNLAVTYQFAGDVRRAISLYQQTLDDHKRILGPDHPDTLTVRSNLASAYHEVGDLGQAIPLFEAVVADRERVSGPEHRSTWDAKNNLASAYDAIGDAGRAIPLYQATHAAMVALLGADHPDSLRLQNNLAMAYMAIGDSNSAIPMLSTVLEHRVELLGPDHPDTLMARNNLAMAHNKADDLEQAIELYERALADFARVLGLDNPDTLIVSNNLAIAYQNVGDFDRAIALHETTLKYRLRRLGPNHPDTLMSHNNLASAHQSSGDAARAQQTYQNALKDFVRVLGPDHPDTLTLRNNLASAQWITGARDQASEQFDAVFTARKRLLGPDNPSTLMSKHNLARVHEWRGDLDRAISLFEETFGAQKRILGPDHSATLKTCYRLAGALESAGKPERALPLYEAVLRDCRHALGPNHVLTRMAQASLKTARRKD